MSAFNQDQGALQTQSNAAGTRHFVVFRVERRRYALPLNNVRRALRMVALTPAPDAPPWIAGLINIGGVALSVLDLRVRFGMRPRAAHINDRLLVVDHAGGTMAILVDEALEVLTCTPAEVNPAPAGLGGVRPLSATLQQDGRLVMVLDAARLLPESAPVESTG